MAPATERRSESLSRELLAYVELGAALIAGALWYVFPAIGLRPLFLVLLIWAAGLTGQYLRAWTYHLRTPLDLPLALFVLTAVVGLWATYHRDSATAYQPFDNAVGWQKFGLILAAASIYYALAHLPNPRSLWLATAGITVAGAASGLYFLLSHDFAAGEAKVAFLHQLGLRIQAARPALALHPFGSNQVGSVLAMTVPLAVQLVLATLCPRDSKSALADSDGHVSEGRLRNAGSGFNRRARSPLVLVTALLLALTGFSLLLTVSRGAWLALAAALLAWAAWSVTARLAARWNARHPDSTLGPAERLIGPLAVGLLALLLARPFVIPFLQGFLGPGINRLELMRLSTLLVRDYPFTGIGLGAFPVVFSTYVLGIHVAYIGSPHNLYIELAVEQGLAGLLAWLAFVAGAFVLAWRARRPAASAGNTALSLPLAGAVSMLIVLLLHGLVDDPLYSRRIALLLFLAPMGLAAAVWRLRVSTLPQEVSVGRLGKRRRGFSRRAAVMGALACVLLVAALAAFRTPLAAAWHANLGALAQTRAELAVYDPEHFGDPTIDEVRRRVDTSAAEQHFMDALELDPTRTVALQRMAQLARARGAYDRSLALMERLAATGADDRLTRLLYADALVANGQVARAVAQVDGLPFARSRLLGQAWEYGVLNDPQRAAWASEAAGLVTEPVAP